MLPEMHRHLLIIDFSLYKNANAFVADVEKFLEAA